MQKKNAQAKNNSNTEWAKVLCPEFFSYVWGSSFHVRQSWQVINIARSFMTFNWAIFSYAEKMKMIIFLGYHTRLLNNFLITCNTTNSSCNASANYSEFKPARIKIRNVQWSSPKNNNFTISLYQWFCFKFFNEKLENS